MRERGGYSLQRAQLRMRERVLPIKSVVENAGEGHSLQRAHLKIAERANNNENRGIGIWRREKCTGICPVFAISDC